MNPCACPHFDINAPYFDIKGASEAVATYRKLSIKQLVATGNYICQEKDFCQLYARICNSVEKHGSWRDKQNESNGFISKMRAIEYYSDWNCINSRLTQLLNIVTGVIHDPQLYRPIDPHIYKWTCLCEDSRTPPIHE